MRHEKGYSPGGSGKSFHFEVDRVWLAGRNRNPAPDEKKKGTSWTIRKPVYHRKCKARVGNLFLVGYLLLRRYVSDVLLSSSAVSPSVSGTSIASRKISQSLRTRFSLRAHCLRGFAWCSFCTTTAASRPSSVLQVVMGAVLSLARCNLALPPRLRAVQLAVGS